MCTCKPLVQELLHYAVTTCCFCYMSPPQIKFHTCEYQYKGHNLAWLTAVTLYYSGVDTPFPYALDIRLSLKLKHHNHDCQFCVWYRVASGLSKFNTVLLCIILCAYPHSHHDNRYLHDLAIYTSLTQKYEIQYSS